MPYGTGKVESIDAEVRHRAEIVFLGQIDELLDEHGLAGSVEPVDGEERSASGAHLADLFEKSCDNAASGVGHASDINAVGPIAGAKMRW